MLRLSKLDRIVRSAQTQADRWRVPFAVLDINPFYAPVYVIRGWEERFLDNPDLIQKVVPCAKVI